MECVEPSISSDIPLSREGKMAYIDAQLRAKHGDGKDEPCFPQNPKRSASDQNSENSAIQPSPRIGNTDWCICDNCVAMPTDLESKCCKEIDNIINVTDEEFSCILQHPFFYDYCQHRERIEINLKMIGQQRHPPNVRDLNRLLRKTAYKGFSAWIHGYLGKGVRRPIPSCAVKVIRDKFPDPEELYMGFRQHQDYPAEYMALD